MSKKKDFNSGPKVDELNGKVQVDGQQMASEINSDLKGPQGGTPEIKEINEPKQAINTKRAAEVVAAGSDSSGIGGLRRGAITFGGGAGVTQGDMSATTKENIPYKSGDRIGRRDDSIVRKVDLTDAEIWKTKMYQSKPLGETTEGQGYNGNYYNEHAITQRNSGGAPADPLFERSVDETCFDMYYWASGQNNIAKNSKNLSIHTWDATANSGNGGYSASPISIVIGNHNASKLQVKIHKVSAGVYEITDFKFVSTDCTNDKIDEATSRLAGDAYLRNYNQSEIDRNIIISTAGNESDPSWSCLGDAIIDATDQNLLLRYLDSMTGNYVYLSMRKLAEALAHQLNKVAKDGSRITGPMSEMVNGCIEKIGYGGDTSVSEANGRTRCFDESAYVAGGAGLWLATNDSLPKYTTKGKLLNLPLSFKSALATAISNADPLVMDKLLSDSMAHNELYSTIDGPYDPLKPVVITDKASLITPIPIDVCSDGTIFDTTNKVLKPIIYTMHYQNVRNKYNINIKNFFVEGIYRWFEERMERLYKNCETQASSNVVTINIPIVSSTTSISLWDLIVCSSVPYIVESRLTTMTELLKYEKNHGYPYSNLVHIKDVDVNACDNYSVSGVESPINVGIAKPVAAIKAIMPELFWPVSKVNGEGLLTGHNGVAAWTVLPHYFVQNQFAYDKDNDTSTPRSLVLSDEGATMAYPSTRAGQMLSYMDTIYGMSEEDYRLSLDRMVVYPGYQPSYTGSKIARAASAGSAVPLLAKTYKYGLTSDGTPVIPYFAYANSADHKGETLQVKDILSTPRELGLFQVAPAGTLTPILNAAGNALNTVAFDSSYLGLSGPGFRITLYHGISNSMENSILNAGSVNINANSSFRYEYKVVYSTPSSAITDVGFWFRAALSSNSMKPFVTGSYNAQANGNYDSTTGTYATAEAKDTSISIKSDFKYMWPRLQRFPFVVNPFDCNTNDLSSASGSQADINAHDIYDFLYMFGFAGFRASDFSILSYQRVKERISKGMNYVSDPYVTKSLLLK